MLVLTLFQHMNTIELIVPPSTQETRVVVSLEDCARKARLGFIAPRQVEILRSDAHVKTAPEK